MHSPVLGNTLTIHFKLSICFPFKNDVFTSPRIYFLPERECILSRLEGYWGAGQGFKARGRVWRLEKKKFTVCSEY